MRYLSRSAEMYHGEAVSPRVHVRRLFECRPRAIAAAQMSHVPNVCRRIRQRVLMTKRVILNVKCAMALRLACTDLTSCRTK